MAWDKNFSIECVSKREIRKFEWIFRQFKEEPRRLSSAKSRGDDAEMAERHTKLRIKEFLRHTLKHMIMRFSQANLKWLSRNASAYCLKQSEKGNPCDGAP